MADPQLEVVHVGSALPRHRRRRSARLAARRRRHVRRADDGPARAADRGDHRRRRRGGRRRTSSTCCARPASTSCSSRSPRARSSTTSRRRRARPDCVRVGVPLPSPRHARRRGGRRALVARPGRRRAPDGWADVVPAERLRRRRLAGPPARAGGRASGSAPRPRPTPLLAPGRPRRGEPSRRRAGRALATLARLLRPGRGPARDQGASAGCWSRVGGDGPRETLRYLPTATDREVDPTGAGDTFLAALLATVLRPAVVGRRRVAPAPDLRFAAAAGSLVVEGPGLAAVPDRAAVLVRRARERVRRAVLPSEVVTGRAAARPPS